MPVPSAGAALMLAQLVGGADDGQHLDVPVLPSSISTAAGTYRRDAALDLVRADGTPVHRYRLLTADRQPPGQD